MDKVYLVNWKDSQRYIVLDVRLAETSGGYQRVRVGYVNIEIRFSN